MEAQNATRTEAGSPVPPPAPAQSPPLLGIGKASDRLGAWSFYFVAKLLLVWRELIGFHLLENLALVAVLAWPLASPRWRRLRHWLAVPAAVALLYYESWLPKASRVFSQAGLVSGFSPDYLAELAARFVSWPVVAMLVVAWAAWFIAARFVRIDVPVVVALMAMPFITQDAAPPAGLAATAAGKASERSAASPDALLKEFYATQAQRFVEFRAPPAASAPFDVILVHACSLSWDDLEATGLSKHPLLAGFDIVLRQFNSVSAYSGPSAIRILRSACGQSSHRDLYSPAPDGCYLLPGLERAGFESQLVLDHDGHFDDFLSFVRAQRVTVAPMPLDGISAPLRSFDGSRIYDDLEVLSRWLETRAKNAAPRVVAYYNSVSLHDGNRLANDASKGSMQTYRSRLSTFLDGMQAFIGKLEASGRRAIVVLVPEHGAAFRGDAVQIAGLREIPSPAITLVPVGIRVIGPGARRIGETLHSDEPASYLALSHVLSRMLDKPPYGADGFLPADYTAGMPVTEFVAENETASVLRRGDKFLLRQDGEPWREFLPARGK